MESIYIVKVGGAIVEENDGSAGCCVISPLCPEEKCWCMAAGAAPHGWPNGSAWKAGW